MKCDICQKEISGYENNAWPLSSGKCCQECDDKYVVPLRIFLSGMVKDQILILKADDSTFEFETVKNELSLKRSQNIVEGYIELYPIRDKFFYYIINEEGLLKKLKINKLAYQLFGMKVLGNMIVCPKNLFKWGDE